MKSSTKTTAAGKKGKKPTAKKTGEQTTFTSSLKKEYLKGKDVVKVTFRLPKVAAVDAKSVHVVGDFNGWSIYANPMKRLKKGEYTTTIELQPGNEYQFRYLIDEVRWENDWNADKYVKSPFGSDNSVIVV